jgi:hypothetical protein
MDVRTPGLSFFTSKEEKGSLMQFEEPLKTSLDNGA